jgi:cytochrome c-type protein NapB
MRKLKFGLPAAVAAFCLTAGIVGAAEVKSLRGAGSIDEKSAPPQIFSTNEGGRLERNFRQQPPLIPHRIDKYEIDLKVNQCMRCHDWPGNADSGAPKISETHYVNRDGVALDHVARTRWFCTQCHVPQADAPALVGNNFEPAKLKH